MLLAFSLLAFSQEVVTDREWYLSGEDAIVAFDTEDRESRVAYAEVIDGKNICASAMFYIENGKGGGRVALPKTMHSGIYNLCIYTRTGRKVVSKPLAVVNALYSSQEDDIEWKKASVSAAANIGKGKGRVVENMPLQMNTEREGHTVAVRLKSESKGNNTALLGVVGKQVNVFEGDFINDSTVLFHTYGISGPQQIVVTVWDEKNKLVPAEIISPFADMNQLFKGWNTHLCFEYSREEVEKRSVEMQKKVRNDSVMSSEYDNVVFATSPALSYNLDEYRAFPTIKDVMTEYLMDVRHTSEDGEENIYIYNPQLHYSAWPALVLIDGAPVDDVKQLLAYDARRVHYINVYNNQFTLGGHIYCGILSVVTRSGSLTNYSLPAEVQHIIYDFPM